MGGQGGGGPVHHKQSESNLLGFFLTSVINVVQNEFLVNSELNGFGVDK